MNELMILSEGTRVKKEVDEKAAKLKKTRKNRIELSKRFVKYSEHWKFIFFILNIEAIVFVTISLSSLNYSFLTSTTYNVISGIFSIYVILLQYYINELNYNERALKTEYHQLEIEDQILKLKSLSIELDYCENTKEILEKKEKYQLIVSNYQTTLKNNENHKRLDRKMNRLNEEEYEVDSNLKKIRDFTLDNIMIYINYVVVCVVLIFDLIGWMWN